MQNGANKPAQPDTELLVFSGMHGVYRIQVQQMSATAGSASMLKNYELYGVHMRTEYFLCPNHATCANGENCKNIHVVPEVKVESLPYSSIHRNMRLPAGEMQTYPAGKSLTVFYPKSRLSENVDSGNVLVTAGATRCFQDSHIPMHQCTHFQRKYCLRGPECGFLHVLSFGHHHTLPVPPLPNAIPGLNPVGLPGMMQSTKVAQPQTVLTQQQVPPQSLAQQQPQIVYIVQQPQQQPQQQMMTIPAGNWGAPQGNPNIPTYVIVQGSGLPTQPIQPGMVM